MNAASIAARFLDLASEEQMTDVTNLKLQKLVVLAESLSIYARGERAFVEPVQAWEHGPVVGPLYTRYRDHGDRPITEVDRDGTAELDEELELIVREVWGVAGHLPPSGLRKLTHDTGPYERYYQAGVRNVVIPPAELGAAWPDYVALASKLTAYRSAARTPVIGAGQRGFASEEEYRAAAAEFRPSSARRVG